MRWQCDHQYYLYFRRQCNRGNGHWTSRRAHQLSNGRLSVDLWYSNCFRNLFHNDNRRLRTVNANRNNYLNARIYACLNLCSRHRQSNGMQRRRNYQDYVYIWRQRHWCDCYRPASRTNEQCCGRSGYDHWFANSGRVLYGHNNGTLCSNIINRYDHADSGSYTYTFFCCGH